MNLKDFKQDPSEENTDTSEKKSSNERIASTGYQEELNTLKIDKLSNKITIISVIIPIMILGILVFAYLDMKERVVDVDQTKQSQVEKMALQMEEQINSIELKIAKNRFDIEKTLPALQKETTALSGQITKLGSSKVSTRTLNSKLAKLNTRIDKNSAQDKTTLQTIERMNKETLATIEANQLQFDKDSVKIKEDINLFKEEFDARLLELSDYEQQIGLLRKDLSLLDKKIKSLQESQKREIQSLKKLMDQQKADFEKKLKQTSSKSKTSVSKVSKNTSTKTSTSKNSPSPQLSIDPSRPHTIQEKKLTN